MCTETTYQTTKGTQRGEGSDRGGAARRDRQRSKVNKEPPSPDGEYAVAGPREELVLHVRRQYRIAWALARLPAASRVVSFFSCRPALVGQGNEGVATLAAEAAETPSLPPGERGQRSERHDLKRSAMVYYRMASPEAVVHDALDGDWIEKRSGRAQSGPLFGGDGPKSVVQWYMRALGGGEATSAVDR